MTPEPSTQRPRLFAVPASSRFRPTGDIGFTRHGGYVHDADLRRMVGPNWYRTIGQMLRSPTVGGVVFAVTQLIRRAEWSWEPADESAEARRLAGLVEEMRLDMETAWEDILAEVLGFLTHGFHLSEIIYRRRPDGLIGWADWSPRPQETITRWQFDDHGRVEAAIQQPPHGAEVVLPIEKCLHLVNVGRARSPQGASVLEPAYDPWYRIRGIEHAEAIGIERELNGYPVLYGPGELWNEGHAADLAAAQELATKVRLNELAGSVIPSDVHPDTKTPLWRLELLTTNGSRAIDTTTVIRRYEAVLVETVLAGFLTIGHGQSGTYNLVSEKTRMFGMALQSWLDQIAETITNQAVRRLGALNGWNPDLLPVLHAGAPDNADLARDGAFFTAIRPLIDRLDDEDQERLYDHLAALGDWPIREQPFGEPEPVVLSPMLPPAQETPAANDDNADDIDEEERDAA